MYEQEIEAGAKCLTDYFGSDKWKKRINISKLDLLHDHYCILGQLFGTFLLGMSLLCPSTDFNEIFNTAKRNGFTNRNALDNGLVALTNEWKTYLSRD